MPLGYDAAAGNLDRKTAVHDSFRGSLKTMVNWQLDTPEELVQLLQVIEQRSHGNTLALPQQDKVQSAWEGVLFSLGKLSMVAPLSEIREILNFPTTLTTVPGTKSWMLGLANIRGNLVPIVDLQSFLTGERTARGRRSRVLVFSGPQMTTGVLVGEMVGMRHFSEEDLIEVRGIGENLSSYVQFGFRQEGKTLPVFSLSSLADDPAFQVAAR
ncbi:type IV pili signal transduction protein PilI [endosymbiont of Riftia pachyptila (vent Ph05)]|nr:type IV pili signal transduction protein PilI [endosymbiont of Riftia pachyptila (vent Ph05)]